MLRHFSGEAVPPMPPIHAPAERSIFKEFLLGIRVEALRGAMSKRTNGPKMVKIVPPCRKAQTLVDAAFCPAATRGKQTQTFSRRDLEKAWFGTHYLLQLFPLMHT